MLLPYDIDIAIIDLIVMTFPTLATAISMLHW